MTKILHRWSSTEQEGNRFALRERMGGAKSQRRPGEEIKISALALIKNKAEVSIYVQSGEPAKCDLLIWDLPAAPILSATWHTRELALRD